MKNILIKLTSALCAGVVMCMSAAYPVGAEERDILPSGYTLGEMQRELDEYCEAQTRFEDDRAFASAAVGVFKGDEVLLTGYYGDIDIENKLPADENSVYEWGSISKTLIWVSAMQLWEQGILDLDRDVREYLPDGFFRHLSYDEPITVMNLMNHNAGWQETTRTIFKTDENDVLPLGEALREIEPAQINPPGEAVAYSNYGAAVAGYVIECVTGQDYCEYVHEHIFEPLGMEHTALNPSHSDNPWVYENRRKTKSYRCSTIGIVALGEKLDYIPAYPAGAAAGTLGDLMTYAQALVNDDAPLFRNKETQEIMLTATDCYGSSDIPMCAHGFFYSEFAVRTFGHSGATTAGQANMLIDPESKTGLVVMVNEPNGNWYLGSTPELVFGRLSADKYASGTGRRVKLDGHYMSLRSTYKGMLKFVPYLQAINLNGLAEAEEIAGGVYLLRSDDGGAALVGERTYSDGSIGLEQPSADMIKDSFYPIKLCLLTLYVLMAVAAFFMLLIRRKLKKHGRWTAFDGSAAMTAGQAARLVSVAAWLCSFMIYAENTGGIPFTQATVIGIVQMLAALVCVISAVTSGISILPNKKDKLLTARYILNTIGCALPVAAIVYFDMYRFWQM